jgi:cytochrome bd-type quinol oxidase subunit 2
MPLKPPEFDVRRGAKSSATGRLAIVGALCAFQYWLLTSTVEALNEGALSIPLPAAITSLVCFVAAAGLVWTGERSLRVARGGRRSVREK